MLRDRPHSLATRVIFTAIASSAIEDLVCDNQPARTAQRQPPDRGRRDLLDHPGAELFAFPERHDAITGAGAVSDAEGLLWSQLRTDRVDHADDAGDLVTAAADRRYAGRLPAAALFARGRDGR